MNTLVHIVRLCARESVAHAHKKKGVALKLKKIKSKEIKKKKKNLHVHYKPLKKNKKLHDCKLVF